MTIPSVRAARAERLVLGSTLAVAAAAWLLLAAAARIPGLAALDHPHGTAAAAVDPLVFQAAWLMMVAAMMLPPSVDYVLVLHRLLATRPRRGRLLLTGIGAYAAVWMAVGGVLQLSDLGVTAAADRWGWLQNRPHLVVAAALTVAGAYQLAPVKIRCLRACRSPAGFVARGWHGRSPGLDVARIGVAYGWSCVGCCWALMMLMLVAGLASLWLMAGLAAVMLAERRLRGFERAVPALGSALLLLAAMIASGLFPVVAH
jgi:predicted metal-binding membrane protein